MLLLIDQFNKGARLLWNSLTLAGYKLPAVAVQYDGFLPEGMVSPYQYYIGTDPVREKRTPLYFDRLSVPEFQELTSTSAMGEIRDYEELRAKVFYAEPKHRRFVKIVDWLDRNGKTVCSDHYDQYGYRFAQTILDGDQHMALKSYYDRSGREVIVENFLTGDILLTENGKTVHFRTKSDFVVHFLRKMGYGLDRILYNSLSTPFFVADKVKGESEGCNLLFWQEPIGQELPGNMKAILGKGAGNTGTILIQERRAWTRIQELPVDQKRFRRLGYLYPFGKRERKGHRALILTNSDQIEKLETIVQGLPELPVSIAAVTEMSAKLLAMERYPNVSLYPAASPEAIAKQLAECDLHLDVNHGNELMNAAAAAFEAEQLIFAFENTVHNRTYICPENIFKPEEAEGMIGRLQLVLNDGKAFEEALLRQHEFAFAATEADYREVIGE